MSIIEVEPEEERRWRVRSEESESLVCHIRCRLPWCRRLLGRQPSQGAEESECIQLGWRFDRRAVVVDGKTLSHAELPTEPGIRHNGVGVVASRREGFGHSLDALRQSILTGEDACC
jgi:hypothetical protein